MKARWNREARDEGEALRRTAGNGGWKDCDAIAINRTHGVGNHGVMELWIYGIKDSRRDGIMELWSDGIME